MAGIGLPPKKKKPAPLQAPPGFDPYPGWTNQPPPPPPEDWYKNIIQADPLYLGDLAAILGESNVERAGTEAALRQAMVRMGGPDALREIMAQLGAQPGWEGLLDEQTIGGAAARDQSGTSIMAQLAKEHAQRNLAIEDINAAKGILSSGQTGYELGEERQRDTLARTEQVDNLLDFLRGGISSFANAEARRAKERNDALEKAAARAQQYGPKPPEPPPPPTTTPELLQQLIKNSKKPPRRPIGGWE